MPDKQEQEQKLEEQEKEIEKQEKKIEKQKDDLEEHKTKVNYLKRRIREIRKEKFYKDSAKVNALKAQLRELRSHSRNQIITLVTTAFGFVAALFWRDSIEAFLKQNFGIAAGSESAWFFQITVALGITVFAAVIIFYISKLR